MEAGNVKTVRKAGNHHGGQSYCREFGFYLKSRDIIKGFEQEMTSRK
jgi:hypothetical protein